MTVLDILYTRVPNDINMINQMLGNNEELKKMAEKVFTSIDKDGNKKLSKEEVKAKLQHLMEVIFNSMDSNDNGFMEVSDREKLKVTFFNPFIEEIFSVMDSIDLPSTNSQFQDIVLKIDGDKNGKASKVEILTFVDGVMKKIDVNGDKMIEMSETAKAIEDMGFLEADKVQTYLEKEKKHGDIFFQSNLDTIDTNNDHKVDKEELNKLLEMPLNNLMAKAPQVMQAYQQYEQANEGLKLGLGVTPDNQKLEKAKQWFLATEGVYGGESTVGSGGFKSTVNVPVFLAMVLFAWQGLR